ncbi:MAG TPA: hypothetical protein VFG54_14710 [Prolixibacteraceae bacterium]|nr:hypothetical protein [Prolixibacteraceae bacterium]
MLSKKKVIQTIARLPEKFSLDELLGEIKRIEEKKDHDHRKDADDKYYMASHHWFG